MIQVVALGVMGAIGLWGHTTHWGSSSHHDEESHDTASAQAAQDKAEKSLPSVTIDSFRIQLKSPDDAAQWGLQLAQPARQPMSREVTVTGVVTYEPSRLAELSSRVAGTVWRVEKQVGQSIRAGDVLAVIDSPAVGQAKADFLSYLADVQLREKMYARLNSFAKGEIAARQIEEAETELRKARVSLFNAQQTLISLGLPVRIEQWQELSEAELQKKIKFLGLPESIVGQQDPSTTTASLVPIVAPFDGVVIGRELAKGEVVSPSQNHFQVADVTRMWIVLNVREQDADDLELGQQVIFTAGSAKVTSTITWMSTAVDEKTRTVEVRCEAENPEVVNSSGHLTGKRLLRANLFGVGQIQIQRDDAALAVPNRALQWFGKSRIAFVQADPKSIEVRTVRPGIVNSQFTQILDGLSDHDMIVVDGSHMLKAELLRQSAAHAAQ